MFAKRMPQLAIVGLRRCNFFSLSNRNSSDILNLASDGKSSAPSLRMSTLYSGALNWSSTGVPSPINVGSGFPVGAASLHTTPIENLSAVQGRSTKEFSGPRMGSIMEHPEYKEMYKRLSKEAKSSLDIVCCHILSKRLIVNLDILELDALSPESHSDKTTKGSAKITEMKDNGAVKVGKLNIKDDGAIERGLKALVDETKVDKKALVEELFAENEKVDKKWDKAFMLKRQLVGFKLLQFVKNGNMRLPLKAHDRLGVILFGGKFTKKDDKAILAWVEKHGETGWNDLARSLGRNYLRAGGVVKGRYEKLLVGKKGAFSEEEDAFIIKEVLKQEPEAFEKPLHKTNLRLKIIATQMKRVISNVQERYAVQIHKTIVRSKAGTLDKDVREKLIQKVKENKWIYGADVKFDELALLPEFEGHNRASLYRLYESMLGNAKERFGLNSRKEVTVDQVEEWFNTSNRYTKSEALIEQEQRIVEAYFEAKRQL